MPSRFRTLPFSFGPPPPSPPENVEDCDQIPITDDDGLELDDQNDAAWADDEGPAEPPTRAALLRARLRDALRWTGKEEARIAAPLRSFGDLVRASLAKVERGGWIPYSSLLAGARLAARDAPGEANKTAPDRRSRSDDGPAVTLLEARIYERTMPGETARDITTPDSKTLSAIATGLGPWAKPRRHKPLDRSIPTWAAFALDAASDDCVCKCKAKLSRRTKAQLIQEIERLGATRIAKETLWSSFSRVGLVALLCGALCEQPGEDGPGKSKSGTGREQSMKRPPRNGHGVPCWRRMSNEDA